MAQNLPINNFLDQMKIPTFLIIIGWLLIVGCQSTTNPPAGGKPDLVILYYNISYADCPWGGPGTISARLKNNGTGDAGPFQVEINGQTTTVNGLAAGQETEAIVPFGSGPIGGVDMAADPDNQLAESQETNNTYSILFTPPPHCPETTPAGALPDLVILYYVVDYDNCPWGGPGAVSVRLKNNGPGDAGPFTVAINGGTTTVGDLAAGQETEAAVPFQSGPIGGVNTIADPDNQVAESDEGNNAYQIVFTPPPPCPTPNP